MTQEEKAKAYDEALEVMRQWVAPCHTKEQLDTLKKSVFPQLAESEDEGIRKELIEFIKWSVDRHFMREDFHQAKRPSEWIAYLEKQKDASKAIEAVDRIDKYIDENVANAHDMKDSNPDKQYYRGWDEALGEMAGILQDVYSEKENKFVPRVLPCSAAWFEDGDEKQKEQKPISQEDFDTAKHEALWGEQKPEWGEEEERKLQKCIKIVERWEEDHDIAYAPYSGMLKSLRP